MLTPLSRPEIAARPGALPPFILLDAHGQEIQAISEYLRELTATDCSPATIKSYAYALLSWLRFLTPHTLDWQAAQPVHVRTYVLWLRTADNPARQHRPDRPPAGSYNAKTGKSVLAKGYKPSTINHHLSVISGIYQHLLSLELIRRNPVPQRLRGERRYAHHRPGDPFQRTARNLYRQKQPSRTPRALSDDLWRELLTSLTCHRDRALFCLLISAAPRAQELLDMTMSDLDWGNQRVRLISKGSREPEWVAASSEFFHWLRLYLTELRPLSPLGAPWLTTRGTRKPMTYTTLRAVLTRANQKLGTNLSLHDFRHTCAMRLANDPTMTLPDIQRHLRHRDISTTQTYLRARSEEVAKRVQAHHHALSQPHPTPPERSDTSPSWQYDPQDLLLLLGPEAPQ